MLRNSAAILVANISVVDADSHLYNISQYFHGERVDYIDYGDADCQWTSGTGWKSVIFNTESSSGADTDSKPARLYRFDEAVPEAFPSRAENETETEYKKYSIVARKTYNSAGSLSDGAELVYLEIPEKNNGVPDGTNDRDVLKWNPAKSGTAGGWDVTPPVGEKTGEGVSSGKIEDAGDYSVLTSLKIPTDTLAGYLLEKESKNMTLKVSTIVKRVYKEGDTVYAEKENVLTVQSKDTNPVASDTFIVSSTTGLGTSGLPDGYTEETFNIVTDSGIYTRKFLVASVQNTTVQTWDYNDKRKLLGVNSDGVIRADLGYLRST
jgi:hypothetical protein